MVTLGPEASFSHQATMDEIASKQDIYTKTTVIFCSNIGAVCQALVNNEAGRAMIPIKNSSDGKVRDAVPQFLRYPLRIAGERTLAIEQCVYYLKEANPQGIEYLISKDNALGQVRINGKNIFPNAQFAERDSTVAAILEAATNPKMAGVGPKMAGDIHHLLDKMHRIDNFQDDPRNATRFLVLDMQDDQLAESTGSDKTSLIAQIPNRPGSLYTTLNLLADEGINLTNIMSYGKAENSGYVTFWMDLDGHQTDKPLSSALNRLLGQGVGLRMLGSYPKYIYTPQHPEGDLNMDHAIESLKREVANGVNPQENKVIAFTLPNKAGALRDALEPFWKRGINLTEIDSLPTGVLDQYAFYLAYTNGIAQGQDAIAELAKRCDQLRVV